MKRYSHEQEFRQKMLQGVNKLSDAVGSTLGPNGRTVLLQNKNQKPTITKDGVSVARFIEFEDPLENAAAQVIKQSAEATVKAAGDGTSTSTVLAQAIINTSTDLFEKVPLLKIKRGFDMAQKHIIEELRTISKDIKTFEEVERIASISANNDNSIGKLIAGAFQEIGKDGTLSVEEGFQSETELKFEEGFKFDSGLIANIFITDERRAVMSYSDVVLMITDYDITDVDSLIPALQFAAHDQRPFVIIADNIESQALAALIANKTRGTLKISGVKAPRFGQERREVLDDLCAFTGATLISKTNGLRLEDVEMKHFGYAKTIESNKYETLIMGGKGEKEKISNRMDALRSLIRSTNDMKEAHRLQERLSRLNGRVAVIQVGAKTPAEGMEKKHRIEDAIEACNAAVKEGIVPGGGIALLRSSEKVYDEVSDLDNDEYKAYHIIINACSAPFKKMLINGGYNVEEMFVNVSNKEINIGYDLTNGQIVDMISAGIIDPTRVVKHALQNAISAAWALLSTDYAIVEE